MTQLIPISCWQLLKRALASLTNTVFTGRLAWMSLHLTSARSLFVYISICRWCKSESLLQLQVKTLMSHLVGVRVFLIPVSRLVTWSCVLMQKLILLRWLWFLPVTSACVGSVCCSVAWYSCCELPRPSPNWPWISQRWGLGRERTVAVG